MGDGDRGFGPIAQTRLERTPDKREVVGSIPTRPTRSTRGRLGLIGNVRRGCSSAGRAPALHAGGHRFESVHLHQRRRWIIRIGPRVSLPRGNLFLFLNVRGANVL